MNKSFAPVGLVAIAFIAVVFVAGKYVKSSTWGQSSQEKQLQSATQVNSAPVEKTKEYDEIVTQGELHDNSKKYIGKKLFVIGQVTRMGRDSIGRTFVVLGYNSIFPGQIEDTEKVICYVKDSSDLAAVFRGSTINAIGKCSGVMSNGLVVLTEAKIKNDAN